MPGKPVKFVTYDLEDGTVVELDEQWLENNDVLFIDPSMYNMDDLCLKLPEGVTRIVRRRRSWWGREAPKGFHLLSAELKNQEA